MATHSSVLTWRIPGTGEPAGLLSTGCCVDIRDGVHLGHAGSWCWESLALACGPIPWPRLITAGHWGVTEGASQAGVTRETQERGEGKGVCMSTHPRTAGHCTPTQPSHHPPSHVPRELFPYPTRRLDREGNGNSLQYFCLANPMEEPGGLQSMGLLRVGHD